MVRYDGGTLTKQRNGLKRESGWQCAAIPGILVGTTDFSVWTHGIF